MTEILFYHLEGRTLESVLPPLIEKSRERGWRVAIQSPSAERIESLDAHLWTWRDDSFLPHAAEPVAEPQEQPVLLQTSESNANVAQVRFLIDRAPLPTDLEAYERVIVMFDGNDDEALADARRLWSEIKARGLAQTYWQCDETGRWHRKA